MNQVYSDVERAVMLRSMRDAAKVFYGMAVQAWLIMKPIRHHSCNAVLRGGAPHIPDLYVRRRGDDSDDGSMPVVASYWKPTPDELRDLNMSGQQIQILLIWPLLLTEAPAVRKPKGAE